MPITQISLEQRGINRMCEKLTPCPYLHCYDKIRVFTADGSSYDSCEKCRYKSGVEGIKHSSSRGAYKEAAQKGRLSKILSFLKGGIIED